MESKNIWLEILHVDKNCGARYGILHTPHGDVEVPMFMPEIGRASCRERV